MANILLVDDEATLLRSMVLQLSRQGHTCHCAESIDDARRVLRTGEMELALIDLKLPDGNGLDLVRELRSEGQSFPIVVITAFGSIPNAVSAMQEGSNDYVEKPIDLEQLSFIVARNLETERLRGRVELYERTREGRDLPELVGESPPFQQALDLARRVANVEVAQASDMPTVLITGETGTGKDMLARYLHAAGPLSEAPFVEVDCASLPRELIESELFGHERGAFTDAKTAKKGLLEIASGGTVFLNEIAEMPVELQAKLLTSLESKTIRRVGGTRALPVNAQVIAATNADLEHRVEGGSFRGDLLYRLNVFTIHLPPLRERDDDALLLADHFLKGLARKYHTAPLALSDEARRLVAGYPWPGNIRELSHVLERAALLQDQGVVEPHHLGLRTEKVSPDEAPLSDDVLLTCTLPEMERRMIEAAMARTNGNVSRAARVLGLSRGALRRRLENADD